MALSGSVKLLLSSGSPQARGCPPLRSHGARAHRPPRVAPPAPSPQQSPPTDPRDGATPRATRLHAATRQSARLPPHRCREPAALRFPPRRSSARIRPELIALRLLVFARTPSASRNSKAPSRAPGAPPPRTAPRTPPGAGGETRTACGGVPRHPKRHVLLQLPRHPPQHPRRIPVEQHLHPRLIRGVTVTLIRCRPQIQPVHQVAHVMRKVPFRKPIPHIRRQQQHLVRRMSSASLPRLLSACCRIIFYGAHS